MSSDVVKVEPKTDVRIFAGRLYNHDYLWFSSNEISKTSTTLPFLHNYALCYALAYYQRGVAYGSTPTYEADLAQMPLYATPASSKLQTETTVVTFNALDSITMRTDLKPPVNTPDLGKRTYLNLVFEKADAEKPDAGYTFYAFCYNGEAPRSVIRLGKKGCPVRLRWNEIRWTSAEWIATPMRPTHPVNPLDIGGDIVRFDPIMLPPHLLLRLAEIQNDWFVRKGGHIVHIPKRVAQKMGLPAKP